MQELELDTGNLSLMFHETVESRRELVVATTERLMGVIRTMPCAQQHLDAVHLALTEALANAIIHGNKEDPNKKVTIWGACEAHEKLLLVITDEGQGFDPASVPDPTLAENIFSARGRGVFLINRLMCEAEYRLGGRQVVLRKRVSPPNRRTQ
jgi:serine/threonine-protein kinase RsbW